MAEPSTGGSGHIEPVLEVDSLARIILPPQLL